MLLIKTGLAVYLFVFGFHVHFCGLDRLMAGILLM